MINMKEIGFPGYCITSKGDVFSLHSKRFLKGTMSAYGYKFVSLPDGSGKFKGKYIHRLVAEIFLENDDPENKTQVNHKDGNKVNNVKDNLEWVTPSSNTQHAHDNLLNKGKNYNQNAVFDKKAEIQNPYDESIPQPNNEEDLRLVCDLIQEGYRDVDISRMTGFNRKSINNIRHNKYNEALIDVILEYNFNFKKEERMSPERVMRICEMLQSGRGVIETAKLLGIDRKTVGNIKNRKTFKNISAKYKW